MNTTGLKKQIKEYIINNIDDAGYETISENATNKEKLQFIADNFKSEAFYTNNLRRFKNNKQLIIAEHLQGLPSYLNIEFSNYNILQLAKKWGFILDTEKKEYQFLENYWDRIAQNIMELFRKYDISI